MTILTGLNNFDSLRFSNFANQWNHSYTAFLTAPTGIHLGISSSFPLIEPAQVNHGMHHGALLVQVNLMIKRRWSRSNSFESILSVSTNDWGKTYYWSTWKQGLNDWIIARDLNSLSKRDAVYCEPPTKFIATSKLKAKVLTPDSNSIYYTTTNHLIQQGYIDTLRDSEQFRPSVPTKLEVDPMHALQMRLDYIFATKELTTKMIQAYVLDNETTAFLTDHYPAMASFLI